MSEYNIVFFTGSRAEYGILKKFLYKLDNNSKINLQIIVTATHLIEKYGMTVKEIENDGFNVVKKIYTSSETTPSAIVKSNATIQQNLSHFFDSNKCDLFIILGDRQEMLAASSTCLIYKVPICHFHGGELTFGNYDEAIRHSLTKQSHIHMTSTDAYKNRVIKMGENPSTVFNVGSLGVENVLELSKETSEYSSRLIDSLEHDYYIVIFHPVTLNNETKLKEEIDIFFKALKKINKRFIFIGSNADTFSDYIFENIENYVNNNGSLFVESLSSKDFSILLKNSNGLLGNSSSGIIEAASLKTPVLNVGDRQQGRLCSKSVINVPNDFESIVAGFDRLKLVQDSDYENPYYKTNSSELAYNILINQLDKGINLKKIFYEEEIEC